MAGSKGTVVQMGAGAIGRGFLGQLWTEAGYQVVFVDINQPLVDALVERRAYPLRLVDNDGFTQLTISPVTACRPDGHLAEVPGFIRDCAFVCTAVGVAALTALDQILYHSLRFRNSDCPPLNILVCENQANAAFLLREAVARQFASRAPRAISRLEETGFVDASVGRMVPPPTPLLLAEDPLLLAAESYKELPIDASAWKGPLPPVAGLLPRQNFAGYVSRKLFTHNGGHALLAYRGFLQGYESIHECLEDHTLVQELNAYWTEVGAALMAEYGFASTEQRSHEADLLRRFGNRALGDTVLRVGRDPARKLRQDDRLVGAALLCLKHSRDARPAARAIAAALRFDPAEDGGATTVQQKIHALGPRQAFCALSGLPADSPLVSLVESEYNSFIR